MFFIFVSAAFGLVFGSFFNVLIRRLPKKESLCFPASHCPHCKRPIKPWENIPLVSFMLLSGKCAGCKAPISFLYPFVEALTGICAIVVYVFYIAPQCTASSSLWHIAATLLQTAVLMVLIPVAIIDIHEFIIPDSITLPGLVLGIIVSLLPGHPTPLESILGIAAGGGSLFFIGLLGERIFKKGEAMGGGDVKLMAMCGAFFGWEISLMAIFLAALLGSLVGIVLLVKGRLSSANNKIPFGPFLALGMWVAVCWGDFFIKAYIGQMDRLLG